jgi:cytochrome c553
MKRLIIFCTALAALPAGADTNRKATPTNPEYVAECGSCHVAFPPGLLGKTDWRKTMARLDRHFGTDASLDGKTGENILAYLENHAGRYGRSLGSAEPRITTTSWFKREHDEVPARVWKDARVKSAANCAACHQSADQGRYGEREIYLPGIGRYEDD